MMPRIGKVEAAFGDCYSGRELKAMIRAATGGSWAFVEEIGLTEYQIGRLMVNRRKSMPD
jgi:hypothetical protein